jgi:hypothetical protein
MTEEQLREQLRLQIAESFYDYTLAVVTMQSTGRKKVEAPVDMLMQLIHQYALSQRLDEWKRIKTAQINHGGSPAPFNPEGLPISTPATQEMTRLLHEFAERRISELTTLLDKEKK